MIRANKSFKFRMIPIDLRIGLDAVLNKDQDLAALLYTSASFLAEISVNSPWKLFIFIIYKNIFCIKVSKIYFI